MKRYPNLLTLDSHKFIVKDGLEYEVAQCINCKGRYAVRTNVRPSKRFPHGMFCSGHCKSDYYK